MTRASRVVPASDPGQHQRRIGVARGTAVFHAPCHSAAHICERPLVRGFQPLWRRSARQLADSEAIPHPFCRRRRAVRSHRRSISTKSMSGASNTSGRSSRFCTTATALSRDSCSIPRGGEDPLDREAGIERVAYRAFSGGLVTTVFIDPGEPHEPRHISSLVLRTGLRRFEH
jgi:hypothetical protein